MTNDSWQGICLLSELKVGDRIRIRGRLTEWWTVASVVTDQPPFPDHVIAVRLMTNTAPESLLVYRPGL
jgi:hypothetical protein